MEAWLHSSTLAACCCNYMHIAVEAYSTLVQSTADPWLQTSAHACSPVMHMSCHSWYSPPAPDVPIPADAVAATRARIEALKKDGPAPESPTTDAIPARTAPAPHPQKQPLGGAAVAAAAAERGPKKLSDVKVNANIAASLGGLQLAPAAKKQTATAAMGECSNVMVYRGVRCAWCGMPAAPLHSCSASGCGPSRLGWT